MRGAGLPRASQLIPTGVDTRGSCARVPETRGPPARAVHGHDELPAEPPGEAAGFAERGVAARPRARARRAAWTSSGRTRPAGRASASTARDGDRAVRGLRAVDGAVLRGARNAVVVPILAGVGDRGEEIVEATGPRGVRWSRRRWAGRGSPCLEPGRDLLVADGAPGPFAAAALRLLGDPAPCGRGWPAEARALAEAGVRLGGCRNDSAASACCATWLTADPRGPQFGLHGAGRDGRDGDLRAGARAAARRARRAWRSRRS